MPQVDFTLEDVKKLIDERLDERFIAEREHTRALVREEVDKQMSRHFTSFVEHNFQPTMDQMDRHFDVIEDHLDRLDIDMAGTRTDMRHVKQVLQIHPRHSVMTAT